MSPSLRNLSLAPSGRRGGQGTLLLSSPTDASAFVDFVLAQYIKQGVEELDQDKLSPLLKLRYKNALADAFADLGKPDQVRRVFVDFQKHLYSSLN